MVEREGPGYAANFASRAAREGLSAREGLRRFREAGGAVANETWFRSFGEALSAIGRRGEIMRAPGSSRPAPDLRGEWTVRRGGGYLYQAEIQIRPRGTSEIIQSHASFRTNRLVTMDEALAGMLDPLEGDLEQYGEELVGGYIVGVYELVSE